MSVFRLDYIGFFHNTQSNNILFNKNRQIHLLHTTIPCDYEAGQRVFVDGALSFKEVVTIENKRIFKPIVHAFRIYALDSWTENKTKPKDVNSVELLATVCAHIVNEDDHSFMQAITQHRHETSQKHRSNFHVILIFDDNLREFVRNNLEKSDRIYVKGSLSSTHIDVNGNKSQSGYIVARSIQRIIR